MKKKKMRNFHQNGIISHFLIFNYSLFAQHLMHVGSSTATIAHSKNHSSTTTNDVATCEDGWDARLHVVVHSDGVLSSQLQSFNRLWNEWVRRYTYCNDCHVDVASFDCTRNWHRTAASTGIRLSEFHFLKLHLTHGTLFICDIFNRIVESEEFDSFLLGMLHFFQTS